MKKDTIIIFQKPGLYFFPHYKDIVFSPFRIPERSFRYLIYKAFYILKLPCCSVFWGDWKKYVKEAEHVIIFDYGYQAGMEKYIRKHNPSCRVSLFFWNLITKERKNHILFSDKTEIYSTDQGDCVTYHLKYNHMFYPREFYKPYAPEYRNRLFFLGVDKGRKKELLYLHHLFKHCGIESDIRVIKDKSSPLSADTEIDCNERMSYKDYLQHVLSSGILLDIVQKGQTSLTMRVVEAIYLSKKLITNNQDIKNYEFYQENNILILPEKLGHASSRQIEDFLNKPFIPYPEEVYEHFSFEHWERSFFSY